MSRATKTDTITVPRTANGTAYNILLRMQPFGYQLEVNLGHGNRPRIRCGTHDPAAAVAFANALDLEALTAKPQPLEEAQPKATDPRIAEVSRYYLDTWMPNRDRKQRSVDGAAAIMNEFESYCRTRNTGRASQVTIATMEGFKAHLRAQGNGAKTIGLKVGTVRAAWNAALESGLMDASNVGRWETPRAEDKEVRSLEPEDLGKVLALLEAGAPHIMPITRWLAFTGNRPSDARDLRWKQVSMATRTVRRTQCKTGRLAMYQVGPEAFKVLEALQRKEGHSPDAHVFRINGGPIHRNYLLRWFADILEETPFNWVRPYTLRHTFGYIMANHAGCPLPVLQVLMGHTKIEMTMRYVRASDAQPALIAFGHLVTTEQNGTQSHAPKKKPKTPSKRA